MIKNIVFDMGDVLLRYEPYQPCLRHARGDKEVAAQLMAAIFDHKDWELADGGMLTLEEQTYRAVKRLSDPRARGEAFSILRDWYLDGLWPLHGAEECVRALHQQGWPLYILSNACLRYPEFQRKILTLDLFSGVMFSASEKCLKPDAVIYHRLCDKFGLKPEECLFIDDRQVNVDGARAVGMQGYVFDGDHEKLLKFIQQING